MAGLIVERSSLTVVLSPAEKLGAARRSDIVVPLSSIVAVRRVDEVRREIRGLRAPGTRLPNLAIGTWRRRGSRDFVAMYRRESGYVIELRGESFDRLLVTSPPVLELDDLADDLSAD